MTQASGTAAAVVSTPVALSLDYGAAAGYIEALEGSLHAGAPVMSAGGPPYTKERARARHARRSEKL